MIGLASRILPSRCTGCGKYCAPGQSICECCEASLPLILAACPQCSRPLPAAPDAPCGQCQQRSPRFDRTLAACDYASPVDRWIIELKFHARLYHARTLAALFHERYAEHIRQHPPERLIPVPLHTRRLRSRGFNQSMEIARHLSASTGIGIDSRTCIRSRDTAPQSTTPYRQKPGNVRKAFTMSRSLPADHVAIVDDVMTSGHTANELSRILKRAGARQVDIWVMARAARPS